MMSRSALLASERSFALVLGALCSLAFAHEARAQASTSIDLEWRAPPGCPSAESVLERIDALAGSAIAADTEVRAEATIAPTRGARLQLTLFVRTRDLHGQRRIEGLSCDDLAGAAAVKIVLLLRSSQSSAATGVAPAPSPASQTASPTAPPSDHPAGSHPRRNPTTATKHARIAPPACSCNCRC